MKLVTSLQMRECDRRTIAGENLPHATDGLVLMERAGRGIFHKIKQDFTHLGQRPILIFCGRGNNGGDGFVLGRLLNEHHLRSVVILLADTGDLTDDAKAQYEKFCLGGGLVRSALDALELSSQVESELRLASRHRPLLVDGMLGTGSRGAPRGVIGASVELINDLRIRRCAEVVAIDLPTGINADTGEVAGGAVIADATISMAYAKVGFFAYPARSYMGRIHVVDIGIPSSVESDVGLPLSLMTRDLAVELMPSPSPDAHKGSMGRLLIVGGSPGLTGAPTLTALAAINNGAGLVTVAAPAGSNAILEEKLTEAMTLPCPQTESGGLAKSALALIGEKLDEADVCVLGPGLGREEETGALVRSLLGRCRQAKLAGLVIDADALFGMGSDGSLKLPESPIPILTPHPGEMARLLGQERLPETIPPWDIAASYAQKSSSVVVLKGAPTVIVASDGEVWINPTGNAGLATGGSGDALAGIIASFLGRGLRPIDAARLGVFLHGYAADHMRLSLVESAITPSGLINRLGRICHNLAQK